jgi:hypothetical protein
MVLILPCGWIKWILLHYGVFKKKCLWLCHVLWVSAIAYVYGNMLEVKYQVINVFAFLELTFLFVIMFSVLESISSIVPILNFFGCVLWFNSWMHYVGLEL